MPGNQKHQRGIEMYGSISDWQALTLIIGSTILREKAFALRSKEISIYKDMEQFSCVKEGNRCRNLRIIVSSIWGSSVSLR